MTARMKALVLKLHMPSMHYMWGILQGVVIVVVGLGFAVILSGQTTNGVPLWPAGLLLSGFGVVFIVLNGKHAARDTPVFEADRMGYRIRGGRIQPWSTFHSAYVSSNYSKGVQKSQTLCIKVNRKWPFGSRKVAQLSDFEHAARMANDIIVFKNRLDGVWLEEARLGTGPAPVVAARERLGRQAVPKQSAWHWLSWFFGRFSKN